MPKPATPNSRPDGRLKFPPTRKTSVYRLRDTKQGSDEDLRAYVLAKYLDRAGFATHAVDKDGLRGLLVSGTIAPGPADWCEVLSILSGNTVTEANQTALGLIVVRTDAATYALTYGMGHLMIDPERIDPGFGIEFAVRCLSEESVTKVRRQLMDARGRMDENFATAGEHIRGFGIEQFGEIVSQISGKIIGVPLTFTRDGKRAAHITGSDRSIKMHVGSTPESLLHDLRQIEEVCARPTPLPEFEFIAQVRPLDPKSEKAQDLDGCLDVMLGEADQNRVGLAVPSECRDRYEFAESFRVSIAGNVGQPTELDVDDLVAAVRHLPDNDRLRTLRKGRIEMFAGTDGADRLSRKVPADHWLTAEVSDDVVHYFYWQGRWYEIGANYLNVIEQRFAELLAQPVSVDLPPWTKATGHDEDWYNKEIAGQDGYVLLDKKTIHTKRLRGGGLEIADALGPDGQFICVKKADKTAELNHLFAQGRVAFETLRYDREARGKLLAKLDRLAPGHPLDPALSSPTVVYAIMLKDGVPLTSQSLFAFAKVSLLHTATALQGMGVRVEIASISRTHSTIRAGSPDERPARTKVA